MLWFGWLRMYFLGENIFLHPGLREKRFANFEPKRSMIGRGQLIFVVKDIRGDEF
jgi:hypothetical protein